MANVSQQAMQYYELIRQGVSPQDAFKQAFPNGIPTAEDRAKEAAKKQQEANIGGVGGMLAGALGTDYLVSSMADKPSIVGSLFSSSAAEPALSYTAGTIPEAVGGASSAGEGISALASGGEAFGGGGAGGSSMATGASGAQSAMGMSSYAIPAAAAITALGQAYMKYGPDILQDKTSASRQWDDRLDLAGIAQAIPGGENLTEDQLREVAQHYEDQGRLNYLGKGFLRTKEKGGMAEGTIFNAAPVSIMSEKVMNRLNGHPDNRKGMSAMRLLDDMYASRGDIITDPYVQQMMRSSPPEGYEGQTGQDFINALEGYRKTPYDFQLNPNAAVPTPEQVQAEMSGQSIAPTPRPTPAQGVGTPSPQFTPEEIKNIGSFGQDLASNWRKLSTVPQNPVRDVTGIMPMNDPGFSNPNWMGNTLEMKTTLPQGMKPSDLGQALQHALASPAPQLPERSKTRSPGIDMYGNRIRY